MHFNFVASFCRIILTLKREKSFKNSKDRTQKRFGGTRRLSRSPSLSKLPIYGNKLAWRKVTGLSAACGKNKDKKSSRFFAKTKKYAWRWHKNSVNDNNYSTQFILFPFGLFYLLLKEISILSCSKLIIKNV